jgi:hypothetical protein
MKDYIYLFSICIFASCGKEEFESPCKIETFKNTSFLGDVYVCHDSPGEYRFPARAHLNYNDSILYMSLVSLDSAVQWYHVDSVRTQCLIWESVVTYRLHPFQNDSFLGELQPNQLSYNLPWDLCEDTFFVGTIEN